MPKIITLAHQKGGVGKSTLCLNLAYSLCKDTKVVVIDYDIQGTLYGLKPVVKEFDILPYSEDFDAISENKDIDFLIIDTPPYLSQNLLPVFLKSDLIIIPTKVGYADVMAIRATIKLIKQAQEENKKLKMADRVSYIRSLIGNGVIISEDIKAVNEINAFALETIKMLLH